MKSSKTTRILIEGSMMIALATVLSIFKLIDMPYGGSVTIASMLPIVIFSYRNGTAWGILSALSYAVIQQLLGLNTLSYVTGWQSVLAVILLDYIAAFTVVGLGGIFKKLSSNQTVALPAGVITVSILRYVLHVIAGATVWAGLSIPDNAAILNSLGYNETYMLPEMIVTAAAAYYVGGLIDFSKPIPERMAAASKASGNPAYAALSGGSFLLGMVIDLWLIAPCLQDKKSGEFIISGLANVDWILVAVVSAITVALGLFFLIKAKEKKEEI